MPPPRTPHGQSLRLAPHISSQTQPGVTQLQGGYQQQAARQLTLARHSQKSSVSLHLQRTLLLPSQVAGVLI